MLFEIVYTVRFLEWKRNWIFISNKDFLIFAQSNEYNAVPLLNNISEIIKSAIFLRSSSPDTELTEHSFMTNPFEMPFKA